MSLLARRKAAAAVFAGDAATRRSPDKGSSAGSPRPREVVQAIRRIRWPPTDAEIFVSHEMEAWERWKHAPEYYGN
jgi:hypothetical protein